MATHEEIVDQVVLGLTQVGALPSAAPVAWPEFGRFARVVHEGFVVPASSLTPIMRRLLYAIGHATQAAEVLAVGSYVGYALAFLAGGASPTRLSGLDPDAEANALARANLQLIATPESINIIDGTAPAALSLVTGRPDLVLLDLDDPEHGKDAYTDSLDALLPVLAPGAVIVAHDVSVARFAADFVRYDEFVRTHPELRGPWSLPVDACGLSLTLVAGPS